MSVTRLIHPQDLAREQGSACPRAPLRAGTLSFTLPDERGTPCVQDLVTLAVSGSALGNPDWFGFSHP